MPLFEVAQDRALIKENRELKKQIEMYKKMYNLLKKQNAQNEKIIKILESNKIILNKDKYDFVSFFKMECSEYHILDYLQTFFGVLPTWESLTSFNLQKFQVWLLNAPKRRGEGTVASSTANLYIVKIKNVLKKGYSNYNDVSTALRATPYAKKKKVWLRPTDLMKLLNVGTLTDKEHEAKRLFLISVITGARISDAGLLSKHNIDGNTLRYIPIKTNSKEAFVSLNDLQIKKLCELFEDERKGVDGDLNSTLKELCKRACLDSSLDVGTPSKSKICKAYEAVTMHTARHTFATIKYRYSSWTEREIADALGHTSFNQTLENYICDRSPVGEHEQTEQNKVKLFGV